MSRGRGSGDYADQPHGSKVPARAVVQRGGIAVGVGRSPRLNDCPAFEPSRPVDVGMAAPDASDDLDPVQPGHPEVHQYDVGPVFGDQRERFVAIRCQSDELQVFHELEQDGEALANEALIVDEQHPVVVGATMFTARQPKP